MQQDPAHLEWIRAQRQSVPLMTSVCTGSLVYAAAGLLRGRPATTYWGSLDQLRALDPSVTVMEHERWVDDGDLITSSGVSAGTGTSAKSIAAVTLSPTCGGEILSQYDAFTSTASPRGTAALANCATMPK